MEIVTRYVADDGKEFADKGECMHYESRERAKVASESNHLIMFAENGGGCGKNKEMVESTQ